MKKSTIISLLVVFLLIPLTLWLGMKLPGRWYYFTGTLIVIEILIPFFLAFEGRKPQAGKRTRTSRARILPREGRFGPCAGTLSGKA